MRNEPTKQRITLNLFDLNPELNGNELTIEVTTIQGPMYDPAYVEGLEKVLGPSQAAFMLDDAAETIWEAQVAAAITATMRRHRR